MARLSCSAWFLFVFLFIVFSSFVSNSEGRKFLVVNKKNTESIADSLFLTALPKGVVAASAPSKKGHAEVVTEKLIARHLIAVERSLRQSVPSPGVGH